MKKISILTLIFSVLIVAFCLNSYAQDLAAQITTLEQRATGIQTQIDQTKQQSQAGLKQQLNLIQSNIDNLVKQRVQVDAQIAKLESQVEEMKKNAQSNLERQVQRYKGELSSIKQQIAGMVAQKNAGPAQPAQKANETTSKAAPVANKATPATNAPAVKEKK
jgi:TolA-binding protein